MIKKLSKLYHLLDNLNFKAEKKLVNILLKEAASKFNQLVKMGFSHDLARDINDIARGYSIWLAHEMIKDRSDLETHLDELGVYTRLENKDIIKSLEKDFINYYRSDLIQIVDWVLVGLNGDYTPYKSYNWSQLIDESNIWHEELSESEGDVNYKENGKVIIDFRDEHGIGFYWVDLETSSCSEEGERMGHCGRSGSGSNLYSLRRNIKINKKEVLNKSVLTMAVDDDGMVTQLKGPKNSKPKEEYHKYIAKILLMERDGKKVINGFKSEYESETDFNLGDINDLELLKKIINENKMLLYQLSTRIAVALKLKDNSMNSSFITTIYPDKSLFSKIVNGAQGFLSSNILYEIYNGEYDSHYWLSGYILNITEFIDLYNRSISQKNKKIIIEIIKNTGQNSSHNNEGFLKDLSNINIDNLTSYLEEDNNYIDILEDSRIIMEVSHALELADIDSKIAEIIKEINYLFSYFGEVKADRGINVNLLKIVKEAISITGSSSQVLEILNDIGYNDEDDVALEFIKLCYDENIFEDRLSIDPDEIQVGFDQELFNEILENQLADLY